MYKYPVAATQCIVEKKKAKFSQTSTLKSHGKIFFLKPFNVYLMHNTKSQEASKRIFAAWNK